MEFLFAVFVLKIRYGLFKFQVLDFKKDHSKKLRKVKNVKYKISFWHFFLMEDNGCSERKMEYGKGASVIQFRQMRLLWFQVNGVRLCLFVIGQLVRGQVHHKGVVLGNFGLYEVGVYPGGLSEQFRSGGGVAQ